MRALSLAVLLALAALTSPAKAEPPPALIEAKRQVRVQSSRESPQ